MKDGVGTSGPENEIITIQIIGAIAYVGRTGPIRCYHRWRPLQADIGRIKVAAQVVHSLSGGAFFITHEYLSYNYSQQYIALNQRILVLCGVCGFPLYAPHFCNSIISRSLHRYTVIINGIDNMMMCNNHLRHGHLKLPNEIEWLCN